MTTLALDDTKTKPAKKTPAADSATTSNAGRKTNLERIEIQLETVRKQRLLDRETKRARRWNADTDPVLTVLLALLALLSIASFVVSFSGLYAAASWAVGDVPWLQFGVPLMLDVSIVALTLNLFVERDRKVSVRGTWIAIAVLAAASSASNVLHTLQVGTGGTLAQVVAGGVLSGGAPLLLAYASDKVAKTLFFDQEAVD